MCVAQWEQLRWKTRVGCGTEALLLAQKMPSGL